MEPRMRSHLYSIPGLVMNGDSPRPSKKVLTLVLVQRDQELLLGYKKRGFGQGKTNGFGGKVEQGETILEGAIRELLEESGIMAQPEDMDKVGEIVFEFKDDPVLLEVHVFLTKVFSGEVVETEEMRPKWFQIDNLPFDQMWVDDELWYPKVLAGQKIKAYFLFEGHETILKTDLRVVEDFS